MQGSQKFVNARSHPQMHASPAEIRRYLVWYICEVKKKRWKSARTTRRTGQYCQNTFPAMPMLTIILRLVEVGAVEAIPRTSKILMS
ncbi:unnamed protein product [Diplocarpon coronariae]